MYWLLIIPVVIAVIAVTFFVMRRMRSIDGASTTKHQRDGTHSLSDVASPDALAANDASLPPDRLSDAITRLLESAAPGERGGFVIFHGMREIDYVQFALEPNGLLLNWPTEQEEGIDRLPVFESELNRRSFEQHPLNDDVAEQIGLLQQGEYVVADDGLYAQAGRSVPILRSLTDNLLRDVFDVADPTGVEITLESDG